MNSVKIADNRHPLIWDLLECQALFRFYIQIHIFWGLLSCFPPIPRKGKNVRIGTGSRKSSPGLPMVHTGLFSFSFLPVPLENVQNGGNIFHSGGHCPWDFLDKMVKMFSLRTVTPVTGYSQPKKETSLMILSQICLLRQGGIRGSPGRTPLSSWKL